MTKAIILHAVCLVAILVVNYCIIKEDGGCIR